MRPDYLKEVERAVNQVSIARRRLVVLRRSRTHSSQDGGLSFNRPKAISCLATSRFHYLSRAFTCCFNRPKAISCLATQVTGLQALELVWRFNRPKAISCLATCFSWSQFPSGERSFNRPKAISCLATFWRLFLGGLVSIYFQAPERDILLFDSAWSS